MLRLRDIVPEGVIDARDGGPSRHASRTAPCTTSPTLLGVAARGWTITPAMGHDAIKVFNLEGP